MTLDDEIGVAAGVMGMSYETYLSLTPYQFQKAYINFIDKINKDREQAELTAWQVARWQVWRTLCPPVGKEISMLDLIELPGDKRLRKEVKPDPERAKRLAEKWKD
jgi:hypothetical protein